jgi:translocation protein SEC63
MCPHPCTDMQPELENTGARIDSDFVPEHDDLIQGQRKKQKRLERRIKRGVLMVAGWTMIAAMIYLILVTARLTPDIWDPYDVLGVSRVRTSSLRVARNII